MPRFWLVSISPGIAAPSTDTSRLLDVPFTNACRTNRCQAPAAIVVVPYVVTLPTLLRSETRPLVSMYTLTIEPPPPVRYPNRLAEVDRLETYTHACVHSSG